MWDVPVNPPTALYLWLSWMIMWQTDVSTIPNQKAMHLNMSKTNIKSYVVQCRGSLTDEWTNAVVKVQMCGCPRICKCAPLFYPSASLFTQIEVCLTRICDSPVCVFPPLFVLARSCNQEHFCIPKVGFGVEETFQRFFLTLTPMFLLHINLLGGPPDCFFLTTLRKNVVLGIITQKCFALSFPTPFEFIVATMGF